MEAGGARGEREESAGGSASGAAAPNGVGEVPGSQINPTASSTTSRRDPAARRPVIGPEAASGAANGRPPLSGRRRRAAGR